MDVSDVTEFAMANAKCIGAVTAACIGFVALRKYKVGGVCKSNANLKGKTVIITGANTGIGLETAKDLAGRGAKIIMASRDLTKTTKAAEEVKKISGNDEVSAFYLNLASLKSVQEFASKIKKDEERIDILINNAGVMACPEWKSDDGYELQFAVNHLGHFHLTNLLLDLIKKSSPSRIVNVSSSAHARGTINFDDINSTTSYSRLKAYGQSKLANVLFTRELSDRLKGSGVTVNALHPGVVSTELPRHMENYLPRLLLFVIKPFQLFMKTPTEGAQTSIYCAVSEDLDNVSGKYFSDCAVKEPAKAAKDKESAVRLWQLSEQLVNDAIKKY